MRTALYLRVSTIHQKPDLQADSLRRYAVRAGLEIVAEYIDMAISGRKEGRPQLQALMRAARHHEFDCVLVFITGHLLASQGQCEIEPEWINPHSESGPRGEDPVGIS